MLVNEIIEDLLSKNKDAYFLSIGSTEERMIKAYSRTLTKVKSEIAKAYEKLGNNPTITELRKFNRLTTIENNIAKEIAQLTKVQINTIHSSIKNNLIQGYYGTGFAVEAGTGVVMDFQGLNKTAIKYALEDNLWIDSLKNNTGKLLTDVKMEFETVLRSNAREEIVSGIAQGKSLRDVQNTISEKFGVSLSRSKTIAQTEMHKSYMKGQATAMNEALKNSKELGIPAAKVWRHNGIGVPRQDHLEADGQFPNADGLFEVGGEELEAPGLGTDPANNINCHCSLGFEVDEAQFGETRFLKVDEARLFSTADEFPSLLSWAAQSFGTEIANSIIYDAALPPITQAMEGSSLIPTNKSLMATKRLGDMTKQELIDYKEVLKAAKKAPTSTADNIAFANEQHAFTQRLLKRITDQEWLERNPSGKAPKKDAGVSVTKTKSVKPTTTTKEYIETPEPAPLSNNTLVKFKDGSDDVIYEITGNYNNRGAVYIRPINLGSNSGIQQVDIDDLVAYKRTNVPKVNKKSFGYEKLKVDELAKPQHYTQFADEFFEKYGVKIKFDTKTTNALSEGTYVRTTKAKFTIGELQSIYRETEMAILEMQQAAPNFVSKNVFERLGYLHLEDTNNLLSKTGSRSRGGVVIGSYNHATKDIRIKTRLSARAKTLDAEHINFINNDVVIGAGNIGKTMKQTIRHEYGHFFDDIFNLRRLRDSNGNSFADIYEKLIRERGAVSLAQNSSSYATSNVREFLAETFSAYTSPDYAMQLIKLPPEVEAWFKDILSRKL